MAEYKITFKIKSNSPTASEYGEMVAYSVYNETLAHRIVDELVAHRAGGVKTAFLLFLEQELCGTVPDKSSSAIVIEKIEKSRIRIEHSPLDAKYFKGITGQ